tara:strand:- start:5068 stop:5430 length:363 start_codon:yes stop_codon:yes gene_type:complete
MDNSIKKKKVLIIEDDSLTLLVLKNLIQNQNCDVIALNDGRKYQDQMMAVDAVILDCGLPFISGEELAREIKTASPKIKVVLTSVSPIENINPEIMNIVDGFIGKPYNTEKIDSLFKLLF